MRAILSVYNKTGLIEFAKGLQELGVEIFSTGGTHKALSEAKVQARGISELTGFPEILDGRVKTLHPVIHGGILARRDLPSHMSELAKNRIKLIDIVVVNLYPFLETVSQEGVALEKALENIDIGGPTLIRASAKNFPSVIVVVDPADYGWVLERMVRGGISLEERKGLAQKAFQHVALYDTAIARYLREDEALPEEITLGFSKIQDLRYGENPHQKAAFYREVLSRDGGITSAKQLWGKELSFNNILDADAAWNVVSDFEEPTVVVIKHTNTCGLASYADLAEAYRRAYAGDPISAFGGIVAFNRKLTADAAREMAKIFYEVVVAPDYEPEALTTLKKKRDLRIIATGDRGGSARGLDYRRVRGGLLVQTPDAVSEDSSTWRVVTERRPTGEELKDMAFAWRVVKHIKSNAIVLARDKALLGMGAGQPNRVTSVHLALRRAEDKAKGSVMASDAFFPFPDSIELAASGGITAVVEPGGSIRDEEVIKAANQHQMAMVFTGVRHFRH